MLQDEAMTPLVPTVTTADCRNLKSEATLQTVLSGYLPNLVFHYLPQHIGLLLMGAPSKEFLGEAHIWSIYLIKPLKRHGSCVAVFCWILNSPIVLLDQ